MTARYYNGGASAEGLFYGEQINMLPKDIDDALAALKDHSDCDNPLAAENEAGSAKKDKQKAAEAAEQKAVAREEKEEAHAPPPEQNPPASTANLPPEGNNTGSFIGADATQPDTTLSPGLDPTMTGASNRRSPVTN